jgi:hypothetical protein
LDTGDAENWYDYYSDNFSLKGDLTAQPNERHSIKTGFESRYTEMQVIDINAPWFGETGLEGIMTIFASIPMTVPSTSRTALPIAA